MFESRTYRGWVKGGDLIPFTATVGETDLYIRAWSEFESQAIVAVKRYRGEIESYIAGHPEFIDSLEPIDVPDDASPIVREMCRVARLCNVGPMAAVAGVLAEAVGRVLKHFSPEVVVENGGDIYIDTKESRTVGIYAGDSPFTGKLAVDIAPDDTPMGICTSSGTVGHSLSFGKADAVVVLSASTPLADAAATAIANVVKTPDDIPAAIEFAQNIEGLAGVIVIVGDKLGAWGKVKLCEGAFE
ncbi:MAG: UPF0280 family protein [Chloroflexota bacterium]|nr:UPF0280 family protein [Chloroflexota bacterium]